MRLAPRRGARAAALAAAAASVAATVAWGASPLTPLSALPDLTPAATTSGPVATVGPLFTGGGAHHSCTASVVASRRGDLALTAAHCLSGTGAGVLFAPGAVGRATPHGVWTVQRAWVDARWERHRDARDDVAVLQLAPHRTGRRAEEVQSVVGGEHLGLTAAALGSLVTVPGYPAGVGGSPITCTAPLRRAHGVPSFDCSGYVGGTSGSPYLVALTARGVSVRPGAGSEVVGLVGGRHEGGCYDWRSFTSVFGRSVRALLARAASGAPGDVLPQAAGPGC